MTVYEELTEIIRGLNESQVRVLLETARRLREANDPLIGLFSGPAELSSRVKEILQDDITPESGWTQKFENV